VPVTGRWTGDLGEGQGFVSGDSVAGRRPAEVGFHHEALLYTGMDEFLAATVPFVAEGVAAGDAVLVVVDLPKIDALRAALGADAAAVEFDDMGRLGRNPACIIPAWQDFVERHAAGRDAVTGDVRLRGVGEPVSAGRDADEVVECHRHEALLNLAFADDPPFVLMCPYDTGTLAPAVVAEAARSHPWIRHRAEAWSSPAYSGAELADELLRHPLGEPASEIHRVRFDSGSLRALRRFVGEHAERVLGRRAADLVLAVSELAANSVRHGGGFGVLRLWEDERGLVCEVTDDGVIAEPLVGRRRPPADEPTGRGMWIVNQVCDLVQVRTAPGGSTVRLRMGPAPL
jgi:anti-sigma regulatory factor (Ser/Thr protein kinase)